jgi:hypothetical protein
MALKVLIVDDSATMRSRVQRTIERSGMANEIPGTGFGGAGASAPQVRLPLENGWVEPALFLNDEPGELRCP